MGLTAAQRRNRAYDKIWDNAKKIGEDKLKAKKCEWCGKPNSKRVKKSSLNNLWGIGSPLNDDVIICDKCKAKLKRGGL